MRISLGRVGNDKTVAFAQNELKKYLLKIDPTLMIDIEIFDKFKEVDGNIIWIGEKLSEDLQKVDDDRLDDAILIDVKKSVGVITGTNPRAVLIAVYRLLREMGVAFVRPSPDGEIVPEKKIVSVDVSVNEKASYRHRTICIEGACAYEHVFNMLDYIPKVGLSGYFYQFTTPNGFFERYYNHLGNEFVEKEETSLERSNAMYRSLLEETEKRGLQHHGVGHGWTAKPFGINGFDWREYEDSLSDEDRQLLAEVDGKREFFKGVPTNTNLCYSNPRARDLITTEILKYCRNHEEIDFIHFWLADNINNNCECEECRKLRPSDFFVMMLNELDEKLTKAGLKTKIAFLSYLDLLWPPIEKKLLNKDRFVFMFAPIHRTFSKSFLDADHKEEVPEYKRNSYDYHNMRSIEKNLAFAKGWNEVYQGDGFDFDYHLGIDMYRDLGCYSSSEVLYRDIVSYRDIGLNGLVSCQKQRVGFPHNLLMHTMAETLWNRDVDFDKISLDYFMSAFGKSGCAVKEYFETLSHTMPASYQRWEEEQVSKDAVNRFNKALQTIYEFDKMIFVNLKNEDLLNNQKKSWKYLEYYSEIMKLVIAGQICKAKGDTDNAKVYCNKAMDWAKHHESELHPVLDVYTLNMVLYSVMVEY